MHNDSDLNDEKDIASALERCLYGGRFLFPLMKWTLRQARRMLQLKR